MEGLTSKIGLGTVQFGVNYGISNKQGMPKIGEVKQIFHLAKQNSIKYLDTAHAYGVAEKRLGIVGVEGFKVVSKFISPKNRGALRIQLEETLKRLKVDRIYGYLAHRPNDILKNEDLWEQLNEFKEEGLVKKIGFSFNDINEANSILDAGFEPEIAQVPYNYIDNRFEEILCVLKKMGCENHARSVFLQGLFFCNPEELPSFFDSVKPILKKLQETTDNLSGALLKYTLEKEYIDKVMIGVNNKNQFSDNIASVLESNCKLETIERGSIANQILIPSLWPKKE